MGCKLLNRIICLNYFVFSEICIYFIHLLNGSKIHIFPLPSLESLTARKMGSSSFPHLNVDIFPLLITQLHAHWWFSLFFLIEHIQDCIVTSAIQILVWNRLGLNCSKVFQFSHLYHPIRDFVLNLRFYSQLETLKDQNTQLLVSSLNYLNFPQTKKPF